MCVNRYEVWVDDEKDSGHNERIDAIDAARGVAEREPDAKVQVWDNYSKPGKHILIQWREQTGVKSVRRSLATAIRQAKGIGVGMTDRLIAVGADEAPALDDPHRIVVTFPDDHNIGGMKIEVIGVTPEQIAVALFHLQYVGNSMVDLAAMQRMQDSAEIARVAKAIQAGKGH